MSVFDQVRFVIYRFHEKGLEVFLVNPELHTDPAVWKIPDGGVSESFSQVEGLIELDPIIDKDGNALRSFAIEGDWHDIPSIRGMIKHDVKRAKRKIKTLLPDVEKGTYFAVKEAFKKVLPDEYAALKELKDILADRNLVQNI